MALIGPDTLNIQPGFHTYTARLCVITDIAEGLAPELCQFPVYFKVFFFIKIQYFFENLKVLIHWSPACFPVFMVCFQTAFTYC